jgi:hypothetical protein
MAFLDDEILFKMPFIVRDAQPPAAVHLYRVLLLVFMIHLGGYKSPAKRLLSALALAVCSFTRLALSGLRCSRLHM